MSNAKFPRFAPSLASLALAALLTVGARAASTPTPPTAERLTLQASLERATKNNPQLLLANKDVAVARTQLRQAKSLYYPKINLNLDYVRYRNETVGITSPELGNVILEAPIAANKDEPRGNPLARNLYLGRLGFLQTLYAGGKINTTYRLSQAGVRRAESAYETLRHEVESETAQEFYRLVALREQKNILSHTLSELDKLALQSSGARSQLAVAAAQSDIRKRLSDLNELEDSVRLKYLHAMGLELFAEVEVDGTLDASATLPDLQTVLVWAKQNRAELKETQIQEEVDQLSVELSRSERYPVFLWGGGVEVRDEDFPLNDTNWNTTLSMNIPLFDGFGNLARVRESRYRADQGRLKRVQLEDQVEMEVRAAHSEWKHWKTEIESRQRQVALVERLRKEAYGVDYLRWQADARMNLIESEYELCAAEARLSKAVGRPVKE